MSSTVIQFAGFQLIIVSSAIIFLYAQIRQPPPETYRTKGLRSIKSITDLVLLQLFSQLFNLFPNLKLLQRSGVIRLALGQRSLLGRIFDGFF